LGDHSRHERLLLGVLLAAALIVGAPAPEGLIFYFVEASFYAIPSIAALLAAVWLFWAASAGSRIGPIQLGVLSVVALFVALSLEFGGVAFVILVGASFVLRLFILNCPRQYAVHAILAGISALGTLVVLLAPGNAIRLSAMGIHESILVRAISTIPSTAFDVAIFLFRRLTNPALMATMVILSFVASQTARQLRSTRPAIVIFSPLVAALAVITIGLWTGRVATGEMLVQRAQNELHFVLVAALALTIVFAARSSLGYSFVGSTISKLAFRDARTALVALSFLMLLTPKFLTATRILLVDFADSSAATANRFALIEDQLASAVRTNKKDVVLPRLSQANAFFQETLREDPHYWVNEELARYMGASSVRIEGRDWNRSQPEHMVGSSGDNSR
jgi:hypothetical protein